MAEQSRWQKIKSRPVETYNKTWLGFIAIAVIGALVGGMLLVKAIGFGYTTYTAEFAQAASLRAGQPITVAGIPMGTVTSMKLVGDHVEAKLSVSDDVKLGKDTKAAIRVTTILGSRYLDLQPEGRDRCPTRPSTWRTRKSPTTCRRLSGTRRTPSIRWTSTRWRNR